jgi:hypothetical protein
MAYPQTIEELKARGYRHSGDGKCNSCGAALEWWDTPTGKHMPTNYGTATPHWSTCPSVNQHRESKTAPAPTSKVTTATLNMDWLKEQAKNCHCVVCNKISGRS